MKRCLVLEKKVGSTPLETLDAWRALHPEYRDVPLSYAGRLDPLAEGKLLVLVGDECRRQDAYAALDKEYEVEILLGAGTDTGDLMGLATLGPESEPAAQQMRKAVAAERGTRLVPYPAFSSKTLAGKPLFEYALEGTLDTITIPTHEERVYRISLTSSRTITNADLLSEIERKLALVSYDPDPRKALGGDFRRPEILAKWRELLHEPRTFTVLKIRATVASGTYMRSLAARIGETLGTMGLAYSIKRTKIGRYRGLGGFGFWVRSY